MAFSKMKNKGDILIKLLYILKVFYVDTLKCTSQFSALCNGTSDFMQKCAMENPNIF
jgi:hypothetical protein